MPMIFGKLAICDICNAVYWVADWDPDWDKTGCLACMEETK